MPKPTRYDILDYVYQTMDEQHCVITALGSEFAKFRMAADKRCYNVFSICPAAPLSALAGIFTCLGIIRFGGAKLHKKKHIQEKKML